MKTGPQLGVWFARVACVVGLLIYAVKVWTFTLSNDFEVFYRTAERFRSGQWDQIYTLADFYGLFRYPPMALPLVAWLAWFPFQVARQVWFFLNLAAIIAGFWFLAKAYAHLMKVKLKAIEPWVWWIALGVLRPTLDSMINSQVDGLMFFGLCLALWGVVMTRASIWGFGAGVYIPSVLKIGTLIVAPVAWWRGPRFFARSLGAMLAVAFAMLVFVRIGAGSGPAFAQILNGWWVNMQTVLVASSDDYIECLDFRSQAINSALLRATVWGWWDVQTAHTLWLLCVGFGLSGYLSMLWFWRKTRPFWHLFSVGVLAYLLLMPFTYRRTLLFLAIPAFLLFASRRTSRWSQAALIAGVLTISLPGKDIVGDTLFFAIQKGSLPVVAMLLMVVAIVLDGRRVKP